MIRSVNPATGQLLREFQPDSPSSVEQKLARAERAFHLHARTPFRHRAELLLQAAALLEAEKQEHARTMTLEMGKPLRASVQEVEKCVLACRFYAENGEKFLADEPVPSSGAGMDEASFRIKYQPLGPILAVMPWNFPFWQVFRFAAPALVAGNVGLLKHASNVPQCALAIESVLLRAGFPEGCFAALMLESGAVEPVLRDRRIRAVTLTGSVAAGKSVAAIAGSCLKKTVLELGGSDPFIVMPSANLDVAVETAVQSRIINNGQSCIAAKRFIIHQEIFDQFQQRFVLRMRSLRVGDPMDGQTELGPLATDRVRQDLAAQVDETLRRGARLLAGGKPGSGPGFFYEPTVLSEIPSESPAQQEELFGPVAALFQCGGIEDAARLANSSAFGLGAALWTGREDETEYFIDNIESGLAFINGMVASDPRAPFGGVKESGYGRELGAFGIREFLNIKTVAVRRSASRPGLGSE